MTLFAQCFCFGAQRGYVVEVKSAFFFRRRCVPGGGWAFCHVVGTDVKALRWFKVKRERVARL